MRKLSELNIGKWIPEHCQVRTETGWKYPSEINHRDMLLVCLVDTVGKKTISKVLPKQYLKMPYKGDMKGSGNILMKGVEDEWFYTETLIDKKYYETETIHYSGTLYAFDINPIVSYIYKVSKTNNANLLQVDYNLNLN
jgi:hypothetical protein